MIKDDEYQHHLAALIQRLRNEKGESAPDALKEVTNPAEISGKQVARILVEDNHGYPRIPMVIEFSDGSFATAYLARETDEDWANLHLTFHAAWTKSQGGQVVKRKWQALQQILYQWGIDTVDYCSPGSTAAMVMLQMLKSANQQPQTDKISRGK